MWYKFIEWIEQNQATCSYKKFLGVRCPGCGMQTAIIYLLKGEVWQSIKEYPALIPVIILFVYLILQLIFKFKKGVKILLYLFYSVLFIIFTNYIIRLIIN